MRVFLYFARAYPWQSLIVLLCLPPSGALKLEVDFEPAAASAEAVA